MNFYDRLNEIKSKYANPQITTNNEFTTLINSSRELSKSINPKQNKKLLNDTFEFMDNGNFKPLLLDLLDVIEENKNPIKLINNSNHKENNSSDDIFEIILQQAKSIESFTKNNNILVSANEKVRNFIKEKYITKEDDKSEFKKLRRDR